MTCHLRLVPRAKLQSGHMVQSMPDQKEGLASRHANAIPTEGAKERTPDEMLSPTKSHRSRETHQEPTSPFSNKISSATGPAAAPLQPGQKIYMLIHIRLIHLEDSVISRTLHIEGSCSTLEATNTAAKTLWWEHSPEGSVENEIPANSLFEGSEPPDLDPHFGEGEFCLEGCTTDGRC